MLDERVSGPRPGGAGSAALSTARASVLAAVRRARGTVTVRQLAAQLDQHPNTVREHVERLVEDGLVLRESSRPNGRGRPALRYRVNPLAAADDQAYTALATELAAHLAESPTVQRDAQAVGRAWGRRLVKAQEQARPGVPLAALHALAKLGFDPVVDGMRVTLLRCPLLAAAHRYPAVVCNVHLGIVQAVLEGEGEQPEKAAIFPFSTVDGCGLELGAGVLEREQRRLESA